MERSNPAAAAEVRVGGERGGNRADGLLNLRCGLSFVSFVPS